MDAFPPIVFIALGISILGILVSGVFGIIDLVVKLAEKHEVEHEIEVITHTQEIAIIEDVLRNELMVVEMELHTKPVNYRHNLHCPLCGRFASKIFGESHSVMTCRTHGVQVRWSEIPVDWAVPPQTVSEGVLIAQVHEELIVPLPLTQPILIIVPDSIKDLEELGAIV